MEAFDGMKHDDKEHNGEHGDTDLFYLRASIAHDAVHRQLLEYVVGDIDRVKHLVSLLSASLVVQQLYLDPLEADALGLEIEERITQSERNMARPAIRLRRRLQQRINEFDESSPGYTDWS
jgi:hypothetical protein